MRVFKSGISALIKEAPARSLAPRGWISPNSHSVFQHILVVYFTVRGRGHVIFPFAGRKGTIISSTIGYSFVSLLFPLLNSLTFSPPPQ